MCLLIVLSRNSPEGALVVAANRDERLDRPAEPMAVLDDGPPAILGGRDELAGGTWLAVNETGVVAGLTNRPTDGGRDPAKRSRGELPLLAAHRCSAADAVTELRRTVDPSDYNPAWMLVGDRDRLFAVDLSGPGALHVEELPPGTHVLENSPFGSDSPKVRHVRSLLRGVETLTGSALQARLVAVLADHDVPADASDPGGDAGPAPVRADCVHAEQYGTRWSCIVTVPDGESAPAIRYADGPPCRTPFADAAGLWKCRPD